MEDKKDIVACLEVLLTLTRAGSDIDKLVLSEDQTTVTIQYMNGCKKWTIVKRMDTILCNLFLRAAV